MLARLDERLARSPIRDGWTARSHFADACASLWLEGALVPLEDLVLHDAHVDVRVPTHELTRAHAVLRARRLEARCRLSPVIIVIEDLHWIDTASEEVLGEVVGAEVKLRLLLLTTRRPEYVPPRARARAPTGRERACAAELPSEIVSTAWRCREKVAAGPGEGLSDLSIVNDLHAVW